MTNHRVSRYILLLCFLFCYADVRTHKEEVCLCVRVFLQISQNKRKSSNTAISWVPLEEIKQIKLCYDEVLVQVVTQILPAALCKCLNQHVSCNGASFICQKKLYLSRHVDVPKICLTNKWVWEVPVAEPWCHTSWLNCMNFCPEWNSDHY